jgi:hypothetical protein
MEIHPSQMSDLILVLRWEDRYYILGKFYASSRKSRTRYLRTACL